MKQCKKEIFIKRALFLLNGAKSYTKVSKNTSGYKNYIS